MYADCAAKQQSNKTGGAKRIEKLAQVMVYANDQEAAANFRVKKLGFVVAAKNDGLGLQWIEVAPSKNSETSLVLHDKAAVAKMDPEMNRGTPSPLFAAENLQKRRADLEGKGVKVGPLAQMPGAGPGV